MTIEIISGSARENSMTYRLALFLQKTLQSNTKHQVGIIDVREHELPALQHVFTSVEHTPEEHKALAEKMFGAQAFILVTPEYNGSYTPAMKNLLDHFPKQSRKAFAIVTASTGGLGGMRAAMQLQQYVYGLFGIGSPHMLITPYIDKKFDAAGNLIEEGFKKNIDVFLGEFLWLAEKIGHN